MGKFIELNHVLTDGMEPYPGLPKISIGAHLDHEASRPLYNHESEFYLGTVSMVTNCGTYLDSPFHRHRDMSDLSDIALEDIAGLPGIVLDGDVSENCSLLFDAAGLDVRGKAVIIRTGWDRHFGTEAYGTKGPYLAKGFVDILIREKAKLVGVDFLNVDNTEDTSRPVHTRLLSEHILIVENLTNLAALPERGFRFFAVPPRIKKGASFPVRAFAEIIP
jgi:kynurenine formamidase